MDSNEAVLCPRHKVKMKKVKIAYFILNPIVGIERKVAMEEAYPRFGSTTQQIEYLERLQERAKDAPIHRVLHMDRRERHPCIRLIAVVLLTGWLGVYSMENEGIV